MSWFNSQLKSSLMALLNVDLLLSCAAREERIEDIRELMLDELEQGNLKFPKIVRRVRYATDAQALWYARGEVMAALNEIHGETIAREKISHISQKFRGLLPKGLKSRTNSLGA